MEDINYFIRLSSCFSAGYTMPQFCIDNNIKKPLFIVADNTGVQTLCEIHTQFCYDKRIKFLPNFCIINNNIENASLDLHFQFNIENIHLKNFNSINFTDYDFIFCLTANKILTEMQNVIYLEELVWRFSIKAYAEIPLLQFLQNHPKVKLFVVNYPRLQQNPNNSENEKLIFSGKLPNSDINDIHKIRPAIEVANGKKVSTPYDFFGYTNQQVYELLEVVGAKTLDDGSTILNDKIDGLVEIRNGKRTTADQPKNYRNKIYFLGNCVYYGFGVPFDKTISSYLQKFLNAYDLPYRVENESQPFNGRYQDLFYNLNKLPVKDNDIIFVCLHQTITNDIPYINTTDIFIRPHEYGEVFPDVDHINELGHKAMAFHFFRLLLENKFFIDFDFNYPAPPPPFHRYGIPKENFSDSNFNDNKELEIYKEKLRAKRLPIGATVMNCNPFTNGHKYLIEYAAAKVQRLYIFVVEEDKSYFSFADRFKLVKDGVAEFSNVEVIPSGKFIISQKTFSGYFNKAELQNVSVDSTQDVEIFAREIAPTLGINIRFVGAEPEDSVTRQYNDNMKNILPRYGIDFCEIPRSEFNGEIISAKSVRDALKIGDFEKISKLVPKTTLDFLRDNYNPPPLPVDNN